MEIITCPYNDKHRMPEKRLVWHLMHCETKDEVAHLFTTCPFNTTHLLKHDEIAAHIESCPTREFL
jgi:hypothetical protein